MGNWLSEFAVRLSGTFFWPLIILTAVGALTALFSLVDRETKKYDFASPNYTNRTFAIWASIQGVLVSWLAYLLISSVPPPNYMVKTVVKTQTVEKLVNKANTLDEAVRLCEKRLLSVYGYQPDIPKTEHRNCETQALLTVRPDLKVLIRTEKVVDPYQSLYDNCVSNNKLDQYDSNPASIKSRNDYCHAQAMQVRQNAGFGNQ